MKNNKILIIVLVVVGILLLCCCSIMAVLVIAGSGEATTPTTTNIRNEKSPTPTPSEAANTPEPIKETGSDNKLDVISYFGKKSTENDLYKITTENSNYVQVRFKQVSCEVEKPEELEEQIHKLTTLEKDKLKNKQVTQRIIRYTYDNMRISLSCSRLDKQMLLTLIKSNLNVNDFKGASATELQKKYEGSYVSQGNSTSEFRYFTGVYQVSASFKNGEKINEFSVQLSNYACNGWDHEFSSEEVNRIFSELKVSQVDLSKLKYSGIAGVTNIENHDGWANIAINCSDTDGGKYFTDVTFRK